MHNTLLCNKKKKKLELLWKIKIGIDGINIEYKRYAERNTQVGERHSAGVFDLCSSFEWEDDAIVYVLIGFILQVWVAGIYRGNTLRHGVLCGGRGGQG